MALRLPVGGRRIAWSIWDYPQPEVNVAAPASDSIHDAILEAVGNEVRAIPLVGVDSLNVIVQMVADARLIDRTAFPCVLVSASPGNETIDLTGGTSAKDDIGYPVTVALLDGADQTNMPAKRKQWLAWRSNLIDAVLHKRLTLTTVAIGYSQFDIGVEFGPIADQGMWFERNTLASMVTLRVRVRKQRRA